MNTTSIIILVLFLAFAALVACYLWRRGVGCSCGCDHCGANCSSRKKKNMLMLIALLMTASTTALAQNPNERLAIIMNDGTAYKLMASKVAGFQAVKLDENQKATKDYEGLLIATKDGKAAWLPLSGIRTINHINGEPTDGALGATWYEIQREWSEHAEVVMLNAINNYNNGKGVITQEYDSNWCGQREMYTVGFLATCDMGYEVDFKIRGLDSGYDYTNLNGFVLWLPQNAEGNTFGQSCWAFPMPPEPLLISATATENTDYEAYPWLGDYYGFPTLLTDNLLFKGTTPSATRLSLKGNRSYIFSSQTTETITSNMEYTYTDGKFSYCPDESGDLSWRGDKTYYGLTGYWITDDLMYLRADDINVDKPENAKRFFMLQNGDKRGFTATIGAKDNWGGRASQYLAELTYDGATHYYYMNNYGAAIYEAKVTFTKGTTIAEGCEATVAYEDNQGVELRFTYSSEDGTNPKFEEYKEPTPDKPESAEWTGANLFQNEQASGVYDGTETSKHHIYVRMDQNLNGSENKGYCSIRVDMSKGYSYDSYFISSGGQYVYNPKEGTITVSQVLLGVQGGGQTERRDLVLRVSEDLQSITLDDSEFDKLYGSRTNTYLYTGEKNPLLAQ